MIIVFEGSNKVGKSTIISKFEKMHNVTKIYNRELMEIMRNVKQESFIAANAMLDVLIPLSKKQNIILDRFHLSEYVYGFLSRGYDCSAETEAIDKRLADAGALLVLVTSEYTHIQDMEKALEYGKIQSQFLTAWRHSRMDKVQIRLEEIS